MNEDYSNKYSESGIWEKISSIIGKVSTTVLREIIILYLMLQADKVPIWVKAAIVGTLGYLICPIDLFPDFLPGGLLDDIAAISALCAEIAVYKSDDIDEEADEMMDNL